MAAMLGWELLWRLWYGMGLIGLEQTTDTGEHLETPA